MRRPVKWSWDEFVALPAQDFVVDISCVTTWTKLDRQTEDHEEKTSRTKSKTSKH